MVDTVPDVPNGVWIGLNSANHSTLCDWTDGSKVDYLNWAEANPVAQTTAETIRCTLPGLFPGFKL